MNTYSDWSADLLVVLATVLAVMCCVMLHFEGLNLMRKRTEVRARVGHRTMIFVVFGLLLLHVAEIWIFAVAIHLLIQHPHVGDVYSLAAVSLLDSVYFSATTFTSTGFGDMVPRGPLRFLVGTESLTGLVLVTWSASFTYLEMTRHWRDR